MVKPTLKTSAAAAYKRIATRAIRVEAQFAESFAFFLFQVCKTFDAHEFDVTKQVKRFPRRRCFQEIADTLQHNPLVIIFKSRQVMMSWILVCYALWLAFYKGGAAWVLLQSRKEEDAIDLLKRLKHVYQALPAWLRDRHPIVRDVETEIQFAPPETGGPGARITAVPQGAHVVRSRTVTAVIGDEIAVQEELADSYTAARPTVQGGGQWIGCGTPNGRTEFGCTLFLDDPETIDTRFGRREREVIEPVNGLEIANNRNGFVAVRAHYTMLPERDPYRTREGNEWFREARQGIPRTQWMQEQEIDFDTLRGRPVFLDYRVDLHSRAKLDWIDGDVLRGWDFGYHRPACVWAQKTNDDRLMLIFELMGRNVPIQVFSDTVLWISGQALSRRLESQPDYLGDPDEFLRRQTRDSMVVEGSRLEAVRRYADNGHFEGFSCFEELPRFPLSGRTFKDIGDPAMHQKGDKGEETSYDVLVGRGIKPRSGELLPKKRIDLTRDLLLPRKGDMRAWIMLSRWGCPILHRGFLGGYHYEKEKEVPEKDYYSHPMDCATYEIYSEFKLDKEKIEKRDAPERSFAWAQQRKKDRARRRERMCL